MSDVSWYETEIEQLKTKIDKLKDWGSRYEKLQDLLQLVQQYPVYKMGSDVLHETPKMNN